MATADRKVHGILGSVPSTLRVLFLQSAAQAGAAETVHSTLARYFDGFVEAYLACVTQVGGQKTSTYSMFDAIHASRVRSLQPRKPTRHNTAFASARSLMSYGVGVTGTIGTLVRYIKQHDIDIVHSAGRRDVFCGNVLAKLTGVKHVVHLHQSCGHWMKASSMWQLKHADGIVSVSKYVADSAIAVGCRPDRVYRALNGLDMTRWRGPGDGTAVRQELDIPADVPVLAIIARVVPRKGHELLLDALSRVRDREFKLLVVGGDDPSTMSRGSGSFVEFLRGKTGELGLTHKVIFTGQRADIQSILSATDFCTMPFLDEGCGLSILEAMAMKRPVIALVSGGVPEIVEHGKSGLLSQPGAVEQLKDNLLTLLDDPTLRQLMGDRGRQRVEEYLNAQRMAEDVEGVYRLVLQARDRR